MPKERCSSWVRSAAELRSGDARRVAGARPATAGLRCATAGHSTPSCHLPPVGHAAVLRGSDGDRQRLMSRQPPHAAVEEVRIRERHLAGLDSREVPLDCTPTLRWRSQYGRVRRHFHTGLVPHPVAFHPDGFGPRERRARNAVQDTLSPTSYHRVEKLPYAPYEGRTVCTSVLLPGDSTAFAVAVAGGTHGAGC